VSQTRLVHHELCFGCGQTNLFGLLMDVRPVGERHVRARGFIKQDHQGADPGSCHEGIILAALTDAMALACGPGVRPARVELELHAHVPVGAFLDVEARGAPNADETLEASATAAVEDRPAATARALFRRHRPPNA
jgi:acyl-coenzyme A thioesterase PaaI-like protein